MSDGVAVSTVLVVYGELDDFSVTDKLVVMIAVALLAIVRNKFAIKPRKNAKVTGTAISQNMIDGIILSPH